MMPDVRRDWTRADAYFPAIERILKSIAGHFLAIEAADPDADVRRATDYVLKIEGSDMAVRVRGPGYGARYRDWTIRAGRASGAETELSKLRRGCGRWYLYGWGDGRADLIDWVLIDLDAVRASGILDMDWRAIRNRDGVTEFIAIPIYQLDRRGLIVCQAGTSRGGGSGAGGGGSGAGTGSDT